MSHAAILGPIGPLADHAEQYADTGLEVFPVNPRDKTPLVSQHLATTVAPTIASWWARWPDALIGHRIDPSMVLTDIDPRHHGADVWRTLQEEVGHDHWPRTRAHASGRGDGGGHNWWLRPGGKLSINGLNQWARDRGIGQPHGTRWSAGIDLLHHDHRYTILPPSPHPETGDPYRWIDGRGLQVEPLEMPEVLRSLIIEVPTVAPPAPAPSLLPESDSIADWYTATHRWAQLLQRHGWQLVHGNGDDDGSQWRHPSATTPVSATIKHHCLFVYSPNTPFEPTEQGDVHGYTLFRAHAVLDHHDDLSAAARAAREERDGTPAPRIDPRELIEDQAPDADSTVGSSWRRTDLTDIIAGLATGTLERPLPTLGRFHGSEGALWYPGRVNGLYGEPGKGKTWIALAVVAEVLTDGGSVAWIDLEEPAVGIITRLMLDLGIDRQAITERFAHFAPEESIHVARAMSDELTALQPTFIVIDSTGEALSLEGAKPNNDDEVAAWFRTWPRWLANKTGAGVLVIDHVVKDETTRGLWPGGSQRKKAAINGSAFMATPIKELGRHTEGRLKLVTSKDRQGHHRAGSKAAEFVLDARNTPTTWRLEATEHLAEGETFRPTVLMERISQCLQAHDEDDGWLSKRRLFDVTRGGVGGNAKARQQALEVLITEGWVEVKISQREHLHRSIKAFRELDQIVGENT